MAIDFLTNNATKSAPETVAVAKGVKTPSSGASSSSTTGITDDVTLTASSVLARGAEVARSSDGIDHDKVDTIKQAVKDGTYQVNYESVADKLVGSEEELASIVGAFM